MGSIIELKARKIAIEGFLRSNAALKSVASVKLSKYKKLLKQSDKICTILPRYIFNNISCVDIKDSILHLVIGCDQGMCGDFAKNISTYLRIYLIKYDETIILLGKKFSKFSIHSNVIYKNIDLSDIGLINLAKFITDYMFENKITSLIFHYYHDKKIQKETIVVTRDVNKQFNIYQFFYITEILRRSFYRSLYAENKERLLNLEQAGTNAEEMHKKIITEFNKVRQEKITNSLNEIIIGVL